jgi:hypothetical protein
MQNEKNHKFFKYLIFILLSYFLISLATPFNKSLRHRSIENQINYLSDILDQGYDDQLQSRFPEGKVFGNVLLALSVIEYCDKNKDFKVEYAEIVDKRIDRLLSKNALRIFPTDINPPYGMIYNGWVNHVLVSYIHSSLFQFSEMQKEILVSSQTIASRLLLAQKDNIKLLDSYAGAHWPADNMIGIVSIQDSVIGQIWLEKLLSETDHPTKLINHAGDQPSIIRGSSSALMTYCLSKIPYSDVIQYNERYKKTFVDQYFGIQLVKENENGSNDSDYDSGPVFFGYGAAATIMNIKTQASLGNKNSEITWAFFNTISLPVNLFHSKYFLFQQEPMFDLFMLWAAVQM